MRHSTIFLITILLTSSHLSGQTHHSGEINGAEFEIIIPENWNNRLVMYAHGYEETEEFGGDSEELEENEELMEEDDGDEFYQIFTSRGYAFAASAFRSKGLVIKEGIEDTEALRVYFEMNYGKPELSIITGHSMGAMITIASIERYPSEYHGAMPLCGWLAPVYRLFATTLDMLATYDYLFGTNNGDPVIGPDLLTPEDFESGLNQNKQLAELYAEHFRIKRQDLAEVLTFFHMAVKESNKRYGGLAVGNTYTIYDGFGYIDDSLNKNIKRYAANLEAQQYVLSYYTPTGKLNDPVIALHTTYDELIPPSNYDQYQQILLSQNSRSLFHQSYVVRDGHCYFTNDEVGNVFDQLVQWIDSGVKPDPKYE